MPLTQLADEPARARAVNDLDSTLLVESAAGTGKTALLAARITMQLVRGKDPRRIAAITFTEAAASELAVRVGLYVDTLLSGRIPPAISLALPDGLNDIQRASLENAAKHLYQLTASTIHAFCQSIITTYSVEAGIDPGAAVLDAEDAELVFTAIFERWIKRRLGIAQRAEDPLEILSREDPARVVRTLKELGALRREHRTASPIPADYSTRPDLAFEAAVEKFRNWFSDQPEEAETAAIVKQLGELAKFYSHCFDSPPHFADLWKLADPPRQDIMRAWKNDRHLDLRTPKTKRGWERVAGNKKKGAELEAIAAEYFDAANMAYRSVLGCIATALTSTLFAETDELLSEYAEFKTAAAVLDFADLLQLARQMLREHEEIRAALASRFEYLFVDEFQDTDPVQAEILFLIAAKEAASNWPECVLRDGSLFLVGDPKQAIYSFRGADIECYNQARKAIQSQRPGSVINLTTNFRSAPGILDHVNCCFSEPLHNSRDQPGYVALTPPKMVSPNHGGGPSVFRLRIEGDRVPLIRESEALEVAEACKRLIGNVQVGDGEGGMRPACAGDIALLTPTRTDLWRYEQALEAAGLPIAATAGKNFFRRQEVQDLLALTRAISNPGDTLALGAFLRGPMVGLSEEELLDITQALPTTEGSGLVTLSLRTDPAVVNNPLAACVLAALRELRARARRMSPAILLMDAVERLEVRSILTEREGARSGRALANVEAFIDRARAYEVGGLQAFARALTVEWKERERAGADEGAVENDGDAIELVTMHKSKGLEWPIVFVINMATMPRPPDQFVHRRDNDTIHWVIREVVPPALAEALAVQHRSLSRERERLWYVACTRARDMLVLPQLISAHEKSWARIIDLRHSTLPDLDLAGSPVRERSLASWGANTQSAEDFAAERATIALHGTQLKWAQPSDADFDRSEHTLASGITEEGTAIVDGAVVGGRLRGVVLHKLMEEVLLGILNDGFESLQERAVVLLGQLADPVEGASPSSEEIATTVARTLQLKEIAALRPTLLPEWPVYALDAEKTIATAGRMDAVSVEAGQVRVVLDWKSDISPRGADIQQHAAQLNSYLQLTGAARGGLVYMSRGLIHWVEPPRPGEST